MYLIYLLIACMYQDYEMNFSYSIFPSLSVLILGCRSWSFLRGIVLVVGARNRSEPQHEI